ncbi:hypothetical protein [Kiloniella sp.]
MKNHDKMIMSLKLDFRFIYESCWSKEDKISYYAAQPSLAMKAS